MFVADSASGLGAENLLTVVLAHISRSTEKAQRANIIAGFLFQVTSLSILGKLLYPAFNYFLQNIVGVEESLPRMRIHMGQCTFFCFYGFARLISNWSAMNQAIEGGKAKVEASEKMIPSAVEAPPVSAPNAADGVEQAAHPGRFGVFVVLLCMQSLVTTTCSMLWPLYIADHFGWDTEQYAWLIFVSSCSGTMATAMAPAVAEAIGQARSMTLAYTMCACCAFATIEGGPIVTSIAVTGILTAMAFVEPGIKAGASTSMPQLFQGSAFGILNSVTGVGAMVGSPFATYVYRLSKGLHSSSVLSDGYFPFVLVGLLAVVSILTLWAAKGYGLLLIAPLKGKVSPPLPRSSRASNS